MCSTQVARTPASFLGAVGLVAAVSTFAVSASPPAQSVKFTRSVVNLESLDSVLQQDPWSGADCKSK